MEHPDAISVRRDGSRGAPGGIAVRGGDDPALEELLEMPAGSNHGRFKFSPAVPRDGVGIEDRDWHEWYHRGSSGSQPQPEM